MTTRREPSETERRIALDARDWVVRLSSGAVSPEDRRRFEAWCLEPLHRRAFERERNFWTLLGEIDPSGKGAVSARARDVGSLASVPSRGPSRRAVFVGGAAALAAAAVVVPKWSGRFLADLSTGAGEQIEATLPDGSGLLLNTASAVAYDFGPGRRRLSLLEGEARVTVRPGERAFELVAGPAMGTLDEGVCAVRLEPDEATFLAVRGEIDVGPGPGWPAVGRVHLDAGRKLRWLAGGVPVTVDADPARDLAWTGGRIVFDAVPFPLAVAELGRYLPERIVLAASSPRTVSGDFAIAGAADAVEALAGTQGLSVRRIPGLLILVS